MSLLTASDQRVKEVVAVTTWHGVQVCSMPTAKLASIEWLRLIAAAGIVVFHAGAPGGVIGYAGLPAFMILSVAFAVTDAGRRPVVEELKHRARRMLMPWVFWSAIYGLLKVVQAAKSGQPVLSEFGVPMLLMGPTVHLWYLPFGFVVTTVMSHFVRLWGGPHLFGAWLVVIVIGALVFVGSSLSVLQVGKLAPLPQWVFILPAVPIGAALACTRGAHWFRCGLLIGTTMGAAGFAVFLRVPYLAIPYIVATCCCVISWSLPYRAGSTLKGWSATSLGVYLIHPIVLASTGALLVQTTRLTSALLAFFLSLLVVRLLRSTALVRFL